MGTWVHGHLGSWALGLGKLSENLYSGDYCPSRSLGSWALVLLYSCTHRLLGTWARKVIYPSRSLGSWALGLLGSWTLVLMGSWAHRLLGSESYLKSSIAVTAPPADPLPMCNGQDCTILEFFSDCCLDEIIGFQVYSSSSFIQDQDFSLA
jgi:hypothetical protein